MSAGRGRPTFLVTVDVEEDISSYLRDSYVGLEQGLPWLLDLLDEMGIPSTFFVLGHVAERFPAQVSAISPSTHQIGCHGYEHTMLYFKSSRWQLRSIERGTRAVEAAAGVRPRLFRGTRFSATARTIRVLERLGYRIDSSILPGSRAAIFRGLVTIRSTRGASKEPYHPDRRNILKVGDSPLWEVPVTPSPIFPGAPLSMGGLNTFGPSRMNAALDVVPASYVIFLIHPWECVDLGARYPALRDWVKKLCAPNRDALHTFLSHAAERFAFGTYDRLGLQPSDSVPP